MNSGSDQGKGRWALNVGLLKIVAIVLPILFLALVDVLRHTVFSEQLHTLPGFLSTYFLITVAVVIFSYSIFGLIGRLQERVAERNRYLSALNTIAKATAGAASLDEILSSSLENILPTMRADAGLICLVDQDSAKHSVVCTRNLPPEMVERIQRAKLKDDTVAQEVMRTGRPVILENVLDNPRVVEAARRIGIKSAISAPLKFEGEVNGILYVAHRRQRSFSAADKDFLEGTGGQLGMAIRQATLYQESELHNSELGALLTVGRIVTSSFDLDDLLNKALDAVIEVTAADAAEIWLADGTEAVNLRCHRGPHREAFLERARFRMGEGIPGIVAQKHEPLVVHGLPSDPRFLRQNVVNAGYQTLHALPLLYQSRLMGVLVVAALSPEAMRQPRELRLFQGIGEWLALAIENARLYQQVQDMAVMQERERIAREMHDGMAQLLGYVNTQTIAARKLLSNGQLAEAQVELTKMEDIARDLYADVREGILGLRIAAKKGEGFLPALREYVERYTEMSGVRVELQTSMEWSQIPTDVEIQLMRIIQEALTNIRKHSKATAAVLAMERNGVELHVTIADNGQGFEPTYLPPTGWPRFGLQTMRERAEAVRGTFKIKTAPGQGTRVEVHVPLSQK
ncbi:MAG: GAF domain-containing protein [Chloroflexi bacterium]|nr:GAF domain-containing protein [Chloroflexota bacterium]